MKALDRFLQRWRIRIAAKFLNRGDSVLDVGSFEGELCDLVPQIGAYCGIDPKVARPLKSGKKQLIPGMFPKDLGEARNFDAITLLAVLEHIPSEQQTSLAASCFSSLKTGGRVIITVPSPAVDHILKVLKTLRLIDGMSLEEHYGFQVSQTVDIFCASGFELEKMATFQFGLNNLFVFKKAAPSTALSGFVPSAVARFR